MTAALLGPLVPAPIRGIVLLVATLSAAAAFCLRGPPVAAALGFALVFARVATGAMAADPSLAAAVLPVEGQWIGEVESVAAPIGGRQRAILKVGPAPRASLESRPPAEARAHGRAGTLRIYARLPRYPPLAPGDRVRLRAQLRSVPAGSGFGEYLVRNRVAATAEVAQLDLVDPTEAVDASAVERLRRRAAELLAATLPEPQAGLAAGILIGLRDRVDRDLADDFTTSGLSHILAISGWNIAIVAALITALLRGLSRAHRSVAVVLAVAGYTVAAGASPSVIRAALMAAIVLLARESGRRGAAPTALGLTASVMVLVDPATVAEPGFQLSVAATAGLLAWAGALTQGLRVRLPARTPAWLVDSLGVSLAAQASTLPLVLLSFGRLSLVAPVANLLVAPLVAPAMLAGLVALLAGLGVALGAPPLLGAAASTVGWAVLGAVIAVAHVSALLPLASLELPSPSNTIAAAAAAGLVVACGTSRGRETVRRV
ncbi:MAG: ComEC family competence protein, partial [Chloroflexota bacterium]|nr:ComEC family competence protein [Chloroflexota bacterium]